MVVCIGTIEILFGTIIVQFELVDHEMGSGFLEKASADCKFRVAVSLIGAIQPTLFLYLFDTSKK